MNHMRRGGVALAAALTVMLTGCGVVEDAVSKATDSTKSDAADATPSGSAPSAASGSADKPIGRASIDLGGSASSLPPEKTSRPDATDCYAGSSRIYDRHGVTCVEARSAMQKYEATPASAKGSEARVDAYTCSHNPDIMVTQGAAPAKCVDGSGNVVFNWRYPGAPQPARG